MTNVVNKPFVMTSEEKELDEIFHGEKKPLHPDTVYETFERPAAAATVTRPINTSKATKTAQKPVRKPTEEYKDAEYQPVKHDPNWLDYLKASVKHIAIFGGLNLLIFYWQQAGLMDASIAIPSMCVCAVLAGFGVGKNTAKGDR